MFLGGGRSATFQSVFIVGNAAAPVTQPPSAGWMDLELLAGTAHTGGLGKGSERRLELLVFWAGTGTTFLPPALKSHAQKCGVVGGGDCDLWGGCVVWGVGEGVESNDEN
ncbi:hypothetical protein BV898_07691 [Hypsibius exemplaris]|uniref:Uncharacterized protein n=1 Tax=Hypsibius exemplaris TaxID=2072580 RepID=A0A1W0WSZ3_HYPEX|nr:hypothetical protein BV898_07691 [Hypsibius exemplaris]